MTLPVQRTRLGQQVAAALRQELQRGAWQGRLPGERVLSRQLGVSRPVLREGLAQLRKAGLLTTGRQGSAVRPGQDFARVAPDRVAEIHVLAPVPATGQRSFTTLWLDELRRCLYDAGFRLVLHDGQRFFTPHPDNALDELVRDHLAAAWVLVHSSREIQEWFVRRALPTVVAGSVHPGLPLSSVRLDVEAATRHAVATLARLGHRRIAFLNVKTDRAGDRESEQAFVETARKSGIDAVIFHHDLRPESVDHAVRRLQASRPRITGALVGHSRTYLTVVSSLARLRLLVPGDLSLISREDDPFLSDLLPAPTVYRANPFHYARRLHRTVMAVCTGQRPSSIARSLVPEFVRGGSIRSLAG